MWNCTPAARSRCSHARSKGAAFMSAGKHAAGSADEGLDAQALAPRRAGPARRTAAAAARSAAGARRSATRTASNGSECVRFRPPLPASRNLRPAEGMASNTCTGLPGLGQHLGGHQARRPRTDHGHGHSTTTSLPCPVRNAALTGASGYASLPPPRGSAASARPARRPAPAATRTCNRAPTIRAAGGCARRRTSRSSRSSSPSVQQLTSLPCQSTTPGVPGPGALAGRMRCAMAAASPPAPPSSANSRATRCNCAAGQVAVARHMEFQQAVHGLAEARFAGRRRLRHRLRPQPAALAGRRQRNHGQPEPSSRRRLRPQRAPPALRGSGMDRRTARSRCHQLRLARRCAAARTRAPAGAARASSPRTAH